MEKINANLKEMSEFLYDGYWKQKGFDVSDSGYKGVIKYNISANYRDPEGMGDEFKVLIRDAFDYIGDVTGIKFEETTSNERAGTIFFQDEDAGRAFAGPQDLDSDGYIDTAVVNIGTDFNIGKVGHFTYWNQAIIHEIGHALGLGHTGNYNGYATYADARFTYDSWQNSIMSYWQPSSNPNVDASDLDTESFMSVDLLALDYLYADQVYKGQTMADRVAHQGDTVYGFNSNAENFAMSNLFSSNKFAVMATIKDTGGIDTIDGSLWEVDLKLNLRVTQETDLVPTVMDFGRIPAPDLSGWTSAQGNLTLAVGTVIENAIGGSGNDEISGNQYANKLVGNSGNDSFIGLAGRDTLYGGAGNDKAYGGQDADYIRGADGNDSLYGDNGNDRIYGDNGNDLLVGGYGNDRVEGGYGNDQAFGGGGNDFIKDYSGNDTIFGGAGVDTIYAGYGNDAIFDFDAKDIIGAGYGNDTVHYESWKEGGKTLTTNLDSSRTSEGGRLWGVENISGSNLANDKIIGDRFANQLWGNGGNDSIYGGNGNDSVFGGNGNDYLYDYSGNDKFDGGAGRDTIYAGYGNDAIYDDYASDHIGAGYGNDTLYYDNWKDGSKTLTTNLATHSSSQGGKFWGVENVSGSNLANDKIIGDGLSNKLWGNGGNDFVYGGDNDDSVYGGKGNDLVFGGNNNDKVYGGDGADGIRGDAGDDRVYGERGDDRVYGDGGNDVLFGGDGNDRVIGGYGNDESYGGKGNDFLQDYAGNDSLNGDEGIDTIYAGYGDDAIYDEYATDQIGAGYGNDTVYYDNWKSDDKTLTTNLASESNSEGGKLWGVENVSGSNLANDKIIGDGVANQLWGNGGNDELNGAGGNDWLLGGSGNDTLTGGAGEDQFVIDAKGRDEIVDFKAGEDRLNLTNEQATDEFSKADLKSMAFTNKDGNFQINFDDNDSLILNGVRVEDLEEEASKQDVDDWSDFVFS